MQGSFIDRLLLPVIVGLSTLVGVLILWQRLITKQGADIQIATKAQALFVKNKMESELSERILPLELLGERWQVHSKKDNADLESDASLVMSRYHVYQGIAWIDPKFNGRWVSPRHGSAGSIDTDLWSDARTRAALHQRREGAKVPGFAPPANFYEARTREATVPDPCRVPNHLRLLPYTGRGTRRAQ